MAHETKSTHRYIDCSWLRNVSTSRAKLPEELGVSKDHSSTDQTTYRGSFRSFGWTEFKMHYHCCEFKMAVFLHISTQLKWLQTQTEFLCVIHLCQCHPHKGRQWPTRTRPALFAGVRVTPGSWLQQRHTARAMEHFKPVDES